MKLTVVGYWHGYPEAGEATSGYLLQAGDKHVLIDCGSGVVSNLQNNCPLEQLNDVILSHYHHDHIADVGVLQYGRLILSKLGKAEEPLTIYGHQQDFEAFKKLAYEPFIQAKCYDARERLNIGAVTVSFFETKHPAPCYAMRFEEGTKSIVYTADTSYFPELAQFAKGCDLLIAECSFYEDQDGRQFGHMNSREVGHLASEAGAKQLLLTHLPHFGDHSILVKEAGKYYQGRIELARSGWEFETE